MGEPCVSPRDYARLVRRAPSTIYRWLYKSRLPGATQDKCSFKWSIPVEAPIPSTGVRSGPRRPHRYWRPTIALIDAMQKEALLVLSIPKESYVTIQKRISELNTGEIQYASHYLDGKLFIVRMR